MAYDERLATCVRALLQGRRAAVEKKMFGGLAFMSREKMFAGILGHDLIVRVGAEASDEAFKKPHTRPMDVTGRPMKGYVYVSPKGIKGPVQLKAWLTQGLSFTASLPPAKQKAAR